MTPAAVCWAIAVLVPGCVLPHSHEILRGAHDLTVLCDVIAGHLEHCREIPPPTE